MLGHFKLKKKKSAGVFGSKSRDLPVQRSKSNKEVSILQYVTGKKQNTAASGRSLARRSKSTTNVNSTKESPEHIYATERLYMRRPALLLDSDQNIHASTINNINSNFVTVSLEDSNASFITTVAIKDEKTLEDLLDCVFRNHGLKEENFTRYHITACKEGIYMAVDLNAPVMDYLASVIEIQPLKDVMEKLDASHSPDQLSSVESCLKYFEEHGLKELPSNTSTDEDSFHLPRVTPLDPIESSWDELDIDPLLKKCLSSKEIGQQQTLWELISTEHSFLRQLEVVINLFMRALELIRRTGLLTEVNYHNIFGYMEEIYLSHEQFWYWVLYPCLERVHIEHCVLDLHEIILRFPTEFSSDFDVYEQHCAFESTNLRSLDEAMHDSEFRTYIEWCESQPECNRLRLKDFLAKPMQRLTKYKLLFGAILKKTTEQSQVGDLEQMMEDISIFVDSVNGVLIAQDETKLVEEVMKKIVGYSPIEIPSEMKELIQPHTHLDLLAPMPDVDITKPRILVLEGKLRYRDQHTRIVAHVFLFSDMLLITKLRGTEKYVVIKPPYKISNVQVHLREAGGISCIVLNEFGVVSTFFTLKAHSVEIAQEWVDHIGAAQEFYSSAVKRKAQSWHILSSLREERTLNGISHDNDHRLSVQSCGSPVLSSSVGLRRVASNESVLSSTSSSAFPYDIQDPLPKQGRRSTVSMNTLPGRTTSEPQNKGSRDRSSFSNLHSDSHVPLSSSASCSPYITPKWQRTLSLNTLLGQQSEHIHSNNSRPKKLSFQITLKDVATQTEPLDDDPRLCFPMESIDYDTDTDEEECKLPMVHSPNHSNEDMTPTTVNIRHRRALSNPNINIINTYMLDTENVQTTTSEEHYDTLSNQSQSETCSSSTGSPRSPVGIHSCSLVDQEGSLMSDIVVALTKVDPDITSVLGNGECLNDSESKRQRSMSLAPDFRFGNFGGDSRHKHRRNPFQLNRITESDENLDEGTSSSSFLRNSNLRRSKSSLELSFNQRKPHLHPPSPLTTNIRRSEERLYVPASPVLKSSILRTRDQHSPTLPLSRMVLLGSSFEEEEKKQENVWQREIGREKEETKDDKQNVKLVKKRHSKERKRKDGVANDVEEEEKSKSNKKDGTAKSKRSLFSLFHGKAMSMESGINDRLPKPNELQPSSYETTVEDSKVQKQSVRRSLPMPISNRQIIFLSKKSVSSSRILPRSHKRIMHVVPSDKRK